jgi:hypothetical protein
VLDAEGGFRVEFSPSPRERAFGATPPEK